MKNNSQGNKDLGINTPSKFIKNLYGILAILIIIIPESIAELLLEIKHKGHFDSLEENDNIWQEIPELRLSVMSIKDLREMARRFNLKGYSRENREGLSRRLLKKLSKNQKIFKSK